MKLKIHYVILSLIIGIFSQTAFAQNLQITGNVKKDVASPGQSYGFKTLVAAQALGDGKALASRKYPLLRFNLTNRAMGISELLKAAKAL